MRNSIRKSLKLNRQSSGYNQIQTNDITNMRATSSRTLKKRFSMKGKASLQTVSTTFTSERDVVGSLVSLPEVRKARQQTFSFFKYGDEQEIIDLRMNVELRVHAAVGKIKTFRKPPREKVTLLIGDGRIVLENENGEHKFEICHIESIQLASKGKVFLSFRGDERFFAIKCENAKNAESVVKQLFIESRRMCFVFDKVLETLLPSDFLKSLRLQLIQEESEIKDLASKLEEQEKLAVEVCLRELVDLTLFARGHEAMEFFDVAAMFSKWLQCVQKVDEAKYWNQVVSAGRVAVETKLNQDVKEFKKNLLDQLRSPTTFDQMTEMKSQSIPENADSRVKRIEVGIKHICKTIERREKLIV